MSTTWNKIRGILSYQAKKQKTQLSYICLVRAQKNGYCHLHILTNYNPTKKRLQQICAKYDNTGFIKIKKHTNTSNYLTQDFNNDHEWHIPFTRRHYTCSRDINLDIYNEISDGNDFLPVPIFDGSASLPPKKIHIQIQNYPTLQESIYEQINHVYGYPTPFSELLSESPIYPKTKPLHIVFNPTLPSGCYINGEFVSNTPPEPPPPNNPYPWIPNYITS
jgi:hypothetical protein